jgi:hypothetical protein
MPQKAIHRAFSVGYSYDLQYQSITNKVGHILQEKAMERVPIVHGIVFPFQFCSPHSFADSHPRTRWHWVPLSGSGSLMLPGWVPVIGLMLLGNCDWYEMSFTRSQKMLHKLTYSIFVCIIISGVYAKLRPNGCPTVGLNAETAVMW